MMAPTFRRPGEGQVVVVWCDGNKWVSAVVRATGKRVRLTQSGDEHDVWRSTFLDKEGNAEEMLFLEAHVIALIRFDETGQKPWVETSGLWTWPNNMNIPTPNMTESEEDEFYALVANIEVVQ